MNEVAITETYKDVEKLIKHVCSRFQRQHGGDFDEMVGEANIVFMDVYESFDATKGSLNTLLYTSIWRRLIDKGLHNARRVKIVATPADNDEYDTNEMLRDFEDTSVGPFDLREFATGLSEDAMTVLKLVFEAPAEVAQIAIGKGDAPRNWRSTVRSYLAETVGWSTGRIGASFEEIKTALVS